MRLILQNGMNIFTTRGTITETVAYSNSLLIFLTLVILSSGGLLVYAMSKKYINIAFLFDMAKMTIKIIISNEEGKKKSSDQLPNEPEAIHIEKAPKAKNNTK